MMLWLILLSVTLVLISAILIWAWHSLANIDRHFLDTIQIDKIQTVLFSGSVASLFSIAIRSFSNKYFHSDK